MDDIELEFLDAEEKMQKTLENYKNKLSRINTGQANPMLLSSIKVNYFGSLMHINELASISINEGTQLLIKPFDHNITRDVVAAINSANLGVQAKNEGDKARINFPKMTQEKRRQLVKSMATTTEEARINIRQIRQHLSKVIKKVDDISEDVTKDFLDDMQDLTNKYIEKVEKIKQAKEKDLLTI